MHHKLNRRHFLAGTAGAAGFLAGAAYGPTILRAAEAQWGDVTGRLMFDGNAPERKKLKVDKDVDCCGKFDIRDEGVMVGDDHGLANVYVYVRSRKVDIHPELADAAEKQVKLDNRDCIFMPHCMWIWHDQQEFHIVNSDPVAQNVAFSPLGDLPANIVMAVGSEATWKFRRAQRVPVPIACNYHPWESAYILPVDNPYAAVTAPDGTFRIAQLPVGKIELQLWHERCGYLETPQWSKGRIELTVKAGVNDLGTVKVSPATLKV